MKTSINNTDDNFDDEMNELLQQQQDFLNGKKKPAALCIKPKLKAGTNKIKKNENLCQLYNNIIIDDNIDTKEIDDNIDTKEIDDNIDTAKATTKLVMSTKPILVDTIFERFTGPFEVPERCVPFDLTMPCTSNNLFTNNINENGFPDVLDLSKYWLLNNENNKQKDIINLENNEIIEKSLFVQAFDELNTNQINPVSLFKKNTQKNEAKNQNDDLNDCKIKEKLLVETKHTKILEEETIKNLEVFKDYGINGDAIDSYSRLAIDPINTNLASKIMKNTVSRQETNIIRLFDILKNDISNNSKKLKLPTESIEICNYAISKLEDIKALYLEQFEVEIEQKIWRFAADVNPIVNGAWALVPIRRVVDAVQLRNNVILKDDIEICVLALSWQVLLLNKRPTLIEVLTDPNEIFVRIAEIFLLSSEVFENDIVKKCVKILLNDYLFDKGLKNLLKFRVSAPIASLDAFMPFYEELLKFFEECSMGNYNFALVILIPAYMNSSIGDGLMLAQTLWTPCRNIVRQLTIPKQSSALIINSIKQWRKTRIVEVEEQQYKAYSQLLAMYATAIRNESITRERNPTVYEIAASELGEFVQRHKFKDQQSNEYSILIKLLTDAVDGRLKF